MTWLSQGFTAEAPSITVTPEIPGDLYSLDWTEASGVQLEVTASFGGTLADAKQLAVKIGGQWKVSEQGYCSVVQLTGVACPG